MATELKRKADSAGVLGSPSSLSQTAPSTDDDGFTKVQKRKQRKLDKHRPQFQYDTSYFRGGKKIGIAHIRDLSLYIVADAQRPSWIVVDVSVASFPVIPRSSQHPSNVTHTVVVLASGLLPEHLGLNPIAPAACMPFETHASEGDARVKTIRKLFAYGCPTRAPGDARKLHSVMGTLLHAPLPESLKKRREAEMKRLTDLAKHDQSSPLLYILPPNQMLEGGYRLPDYVSPSDKRFIPGELPPDVAEMLKDEQHDGDTFGQDVASAGFAAPAVPRPVVVDELGRRRRGNVRGEEGWVETPKAKGPPPDGRYPVLAIDCEMVLSEDGQELARVSVVDMEGKRVFDQLVTPPKPVIDYLTQFSGITEERLSTAEYTFESVQKALVTGPDPVITPHTILLGHSLDCDLAVLKIKHPLVIDTSVIYRHARGPPYKPALKWLAQKWLQRVIQNHEGGHDSEEDARTCVDLLKMKLAHGPDFGDPNVDSEAIFERLNRSRKNGERRTSLIADHGNPGGWYGAKATKAVACRTDDEVVDAVCAHVGSYDYTFCRLKELGGVQHWNSEPGGTINMADVSESVELAEALDDFDARLARLHAALPSNSALILLTGHSDPRPMLDLASRQARFQRAYRALGTVDGIPDSDRWTTEDERLLEQAAALAREGMAFFCVKK